MSLKKVIELAANFEIKIQKRAALYENQAHNLLYNINVYSGQILKILAEHPERASVLDPKIVELEKMDKDLERAKHFILNYLNRN